MRPVTSLTIHLSYFVSAYILCGEGSLAPPRDSRAVQIALNADALHIHGRRTQVGVVKRVLRRRHRAGLFRDDAPEGVPRLMEMNMLYSGFPRIKFQIADKSM